MVLGNFHNPDNSQVRAYALAVGAGGSCLDIFFSCLSCTFLPPSLWETAGYKD